MKISKKIEYYLFIILLFFQNFAVIATEDFGINGLVLFLIFISIINYKKFYMKINKNFLLFLIAVIAVLFCGSFFNDIFYVTQIIKVILTIWLVYVVYIYMKDVYNKNHQKYFWKYYTTVSVVMFSYGIYEYLANIFKFPLFMNIFSNNTSYTVYEINSYYGLAAWSGTSRLHNVFFEPSIFSVFLVYNFFLIKELKYITKKKKILICALILFNLNFTYARTGMVMFIYMIGIFLLYKMFYNKAKIFDNILFLLPFLNMVIMANVGLYMYTDLSSLQRTYSALYYFMHSFDSFKSILIGHGCGSVVNSDVNEDYVEAVTNNGYVDLMYQFGIPLFIYFLILTKSSIKKIKYNRYLIVGVLATISCFGVYYFVETIAALTILIYVFCNEENKIRNQQIK